MGQTRAILLFVLYFALGTSAYRAQDTEAEQPLTKVLNTLEGQFDYRFNYLEETVNQVFLDPPEPSLSFEQVLDYLRNQTGLRFTILADRFVSVTPAQGGMLCGYLKDKDTMEPLASATIQGSSTSTVSDENGYFELTVTSRLDNITIRYLGYRTLFRSYPYFNTTGCNPIYLNREEENLSQVILSNYLVEGISKINTGDLEIDFTKFNLLPGLIETDVLQSVQAFPGIQSINETVSNINIRGGTHDQNLILWDDIKMYQSGHFFGLISVFNPQITQKVTFKKSGTSASYSDGVSGTIAMATDERVNTKFEGNLGANLIDANGFVDVPLGAKSSIQIAARKSLSDLLTTPTYDAYFTRIAQDTEVESNEATVMNTGQQFDFYDTSLRWNYRISEKDHLRLNFININNELVFNENAVIDTEETSRESKLSQNSIAGGIFYQRDWNDELQTSIHIYETDYKLKAVNANLFREQRFLQENQVSETGARVKSSYWISKKLLLHLGYQFIETEITNLDDVDVPPVRNLISEVVRTQSGFTQLDLSSTDKKTLLNIGFRYNYLDKFNKHLYQPRLSFHQQFAEHFSVQASGELKHQITSQIINFQNDFLGIEKRRWQLSNDDDIPVIESQQVAVALNFSRKGWLLSAEGYYKNVDGITTQSQGFQNQYEFVKTDGSYQVSGLDLLVRKRFKNTNLWLSYSFMDNQYTFDSLPESSFPSNLDITHAVTFGATYRYKTLRVSAGFNWRSGKPTTRPVEGMELVDGDINYGPTNTARLDDYMRVDASAMYQFSLGKVAAEVGVSVWNILDEDNEINNYYRVNDLDEAEEFLQSSLGLTTNAMLRVYF